MSVNGMESLHSFLNEEGRELVNVKFFPGTGRGVRPETVAKEAQACIKRAFASGLADNPPMSGRPKASL